MMVYPESGNYGYLSSPVCDSHTLADSASAASLSR
jgi:hypothetical protein